MNMTPAVRALWLAVMTLAALIVASASGILTWLAGAKVPAAVIAGAGAFGGTLALCLLIAGFLAGRP